MKTPDTATGPDGPAPAPEEHGARTPRVSVIVPVYNSAPYVGDCLRSVLDQTILDGAPDAVEILAVDDGSTDGSDRVLAELAAAHPQIRVISQENSGSPGGARNPAIGRATGEYVFFLDSDDLLARDALADMVAMAESAASDVVLCKIAGMGGRHAPASMFHRTVADADLVADKVFNTLGPTKLIRRSLIEEQHLRFPTDQTVGEDQPFMAAAYLAARKVSILADRDYYFVRHRDDGTNMTLSEQSVASHLERAVRLAQVVEERTEPGALRDGVLRRPFSRSMGKVLDGRWLREDEQSRADLAREASAQLAHLYTEGVREELPASVRNKLDLLFAGDLEGLRLYIEHRESGAPRAIERRDGAFRAVLPAELAAHFADTVLAAPAPEIAVRLEDVRITGTSVRIAASATLGDLITPPDEIGLRLTRRSDHRAIDLAPEPGPDVEPDPDPGADSGAGRGPAAGEGARARRRVVGVAEDLPPGVWDVHVRIRVQDWEKLVRLGKRRAKALEPEGASNLGERPARRDALVAYYTEGHGNLSLDAGLRLHKRAATATVLGLALDENARCTALVQIPREPEPGDAFHARITGVRQHYGRHLLPVQRIGDRLLAVRLPASSSLIGGRIALDSVLGGVRAELPIAGARHWPAHGAGYGLAPVDGGAVDVVVVEEQPAWTADDAAAAAAAELTRLTPLTGHDGCTGDDGPRSGAHGAGSRLRRLAGRSVGAVPVVGPTLARASRRLRRR
ncbi:glycosyltransferase family 2 protein [Brachybacterium sp. DNPG3]